MSCDADGHLAFWNLSVDAPVLNFRAHAQQVTCIAFNPGASVLATASKDALIKVWTGTSEKPLYELQGHAQAVNALSWSHTGPGTDNPEQPQWLASVGSDQCLKVWKVNTCIQTLREHDDAVISVAFDPRNRHLAAGDFGGLVVVWGLPGFELKHKWRSQGGSPIYCL